MPDSVERTDDDSRPGRRLQAHDNPGTLPWGDPTHYERHSAQTKIVMLEATVTALHFERDCLRRRIAELEDERRSLESNVETLETRLDAKDEQHQQIIDTYEQILTRRAECGPAGATDWDGPADPDKAPSDQNTADEDASSTGQSLLEFLRASDEK